MVQTETLTVRSAISVGGEPQDVAITPDGAAVYVAGCGKSGDSFTVCVIDAGTDEVTWTLPVGGTPPTAVAVTPDGAKAYVTNCGAGSCVVEVSSNTVAGNIAGVGRGAAGFTFSRDGSVAYIPNPELDSISVVDTQSDSEFDVVGGVSAPLCVGMTPDGTFAYATSPSSDRITVIDTADNEIVAVTTTPPGLEPYCVAVARFACTGDCDGNAAVSMDEVLQGARLAFDRSSLAQCPAFDENDDGQVAAGEIVAAVRNAVRGCT